MHSRPQMFRPRLIATSRNQHQSNPGARFKMQCYVIKHVILFFVNTIDLLVLCFIAAVVVAWYDHFLLSQVSKLLRLSSAIKDNAII